MIQLIKLYRGIKKSPFKHLVKLRWYIGKVQFGAPIFYPRNYESKVFVKSINLGWKDKFGTPRFEWAPQYVIHFFKWQAIVTVDTISGVWADEFWERYLWWRDYSGRDIEVAKNTWGWEDMKGNNTWNKDFDI